MQEIPPLGMNLTPLYNAYVGVKEVMMLLIDPKFIKDPLHYIIQCLLAVAALAAILLSMDAVFHTVMIASFGATSFIVFAMPHLKTCVPRRLIGGYVVGIAVGTACSLAYTALCGVTDLSFLRGLFGALAVGASIFLMAITNTEHPPAAGLALGLVYQGVDILSLAVIMLAVLALTAIKQILKNYLINLFD